MNESQWTPIAMKPVKKGNFGIKAERNARHAMRLVNFATTAIRMHAANAMTLFCILLIAHA